jgi:rod shape-determining protein MreC
MYRAGVAVARGTQVEKATGSFGRVVGLPLAGIDRNRQVLVIMSNHALPARPPQETPPSGNRRKLPAMAPVPTPPLPASPLPAAGAPAAVQSPVAPVTPVTPGAAPGTAQVPAASTPAAPAPAAPTPTR